MTMAHSFLSILEDIKCRAVAENKVSNIVEVFDDYVTIMDHIHKNQQISSPAALQSASELALFGKYWPDEHFPFQPCYEQQFQIMYEKAKGNCELRFTIEHKKRSTQYQNLAASHGSAFAHYRLERSLWEAMWPEEEFPGIDPRPKKNRKRGPFPKTGPAHPPKATKINKAGPSLPTSLPTASQAQSAAQEPILKLDPDDPLLPLQVEGLFEVNNSSTAYLESTPQQAEIPVAVNEPLSAPVVSSATPVLQLAQAIPSPSPSPSRACHPLFGTNPFAIGPIRFSPQANLQLVSQTRAVRPPKRGPDNLTAIPPAQLQAITSAAAQTGLVDPREKNEFLEVNERDGKRRKFS